MSYFGLFMARYIIELAQAHLQIAKNYQKRSKHKHPSGLKKHIQIFDGVKICGAVSIGGVRPPT